MPGLTKTCQKLGLSFWHYPVIGWALATAILLFRPSPIWLRHARAKVWLCLLSEPMAIEPTKSVGIATRSAPLTRDQSCHARDRKPLKLWLMISYTNSI